jgi:hypothetical protein
MLYVWSEANIQYLTENYIKMSDADMAAHLKFSVYNVERKRYELKLMKYRGFLPEYIKRQRAEAKKLKRQQQKAKSIPPQKVESKHKSRIATKQIDYATLKAVRVDHKTWVYPQAGQTKQALKDKYTEHFTVSGLLKVRKHLSK